jgi:hypothetical protein
MNYLKAVFWDYPQFTDRKKLESTLQKSRGSSKYLWFLGRFLEHGRAVDVFSYFKPEEIARNLDQLKLRPYTRKKWKRLVEVYGTAERR